ncbi:MAG: hypothetical protein HQK51_01755 [Oligoflexia bacterium]|nr:hypothetical protein [Oligoflexia bacterium]
MRYLCLCAIVISISISISISITEKCYADEGSGGAGAGTEGALAKAVLLGEWDNSNEDYFGPTFPTYKFNFYSGEYEDKENFYQKNFVNSLWPTPLIDLQKYFSEEFLEGYRCSNTLLNKYVSYIHYLYRLQTLSYLYESLNDYKINVEKLRLNKTKVCSIDWVKFIAECKPKSQEMIKFKKRSEVLFERLAEEDKILKYFSNSEKDEWLKKLVATKDDPPPKGITYTRIHDWCYLNNLSCENIKTTNLSSVMNDACMSDKSIFLSVCSEEDHLFGVSIAPILKDLLAEAHTMSLINSEGKGKGCLDRFVNIFRKKERVPIYLQDLFWEAYNQISYSKLEGEQRYPQGRIFAAGSLKEFDDKGLELSLFLKPSPIPVPTIILTAKPSPPVIVAKVDKLTPKIIPKIIPKTIPTPIPTIIPTPEPAKLSAFEEACATVATKSALVTVNMNKFKKDYSLTPKRLKYLLKNIEQYKTQEALMAMKKLDKLGSSESPLPLVFLKLMIDQRDYHGLFNIVRIVGEEFYVINDLEKKKNPVLILLKADEATAEWQIMIKAIE